MTEIQIRIIEAAEKAFAQSGFAGASVREITAAAGVNVAAINYHFGSKEELFLNMIRYRLKPINERRIRMLNAAEKAKKPIPIQQIVDIMIRPLIEGFIANGDHEFSFMRAVGRGFSEETKFHQILFKDVLAEVISRFRQALALTLPDLPPSELGFCYHFISCMISGVMSQHPQIAVMTNGAVKPSDVDPMTDRLVDFVAAGITSLASNNAAPKKGVSKS